MFWSLGALAPSPKRAATAPKSTWGVQATSIKALVFHSDGVKLDPPNETFFHTKVLELAQVREGTNKKTAKMNRMISPIMCRHHKDFLLNSQCPEV
ncbi:hypothetical protein EBT16_03280 [bacterium]|nr:hypothetical protein [bacterium]